MDSTAYKIQLILHVLMAVVAFGPLFVLPRLHRADADAAAKFHLRVSLPALVLTWVFGMGLMGLSDKAWGFGQLWIDLSTLLWVVLVAVAAAVIAPGLRKGAEGRARVAAGMGVSHLLVVVVLALMVFKPGI
ncbi:MAG: hypothetical protein FJW83_00685 [Actinobacteria bacterium]|nr:hypothetical protein [Actinomycetota bacterium]